MFIFLTKQLHIVASCLDNNGRLFFGFEDSDIVGEGVLGTVLSSGILIQHDLDLDTEDTLSQHNVTNSAINKITDGLTRVDHETIGKLHRLGTSSTELTRDNDFASYPVSTFTAQQIKSYPWHQSP